MSNLALIADIGGTNSRFALCEEGSVEPLEAQQFRNANFGSLYDVMQHYLSQVRRKTARGCIAVACPVTGDTVQLTNNNWRFSTSELRGKLKLKTLRVVNDFTALAMAVPYLPKEDVTQVGMGTSAAHAPIGVLGPGTGLGVSGLLWSGSSWVPIQGEGGHINFAPGNDLEVEILRIGWRHFDKFVSVERLLCGAGLSFLYRTMAKIEGRKVEELSEKDIATRAVEANDVYCRAAVDMFCAVLGSVAGNHALTLGAFGGVYIGGGIVPKLGPLFAETPFRARFEDKGRFTDYVTRIPTYTIASHMRATLYGAAAVLKEKF